MVHPDHIIKRSVITIGLKKLAQVEVYPLHLKVYYFKPTATPSTPATATPIPTAAGAGAATPNSNTKTNGSSNTSKNTAISSTMDFYFSKKTSIKELKQCVWKG